MALETGVSIIVEVGLLTNDVREVPTTLENFIGTVADYAIDGQDLSVSEYGLGDDSLWDDGRTVSKSWTMTLNMNYRPDDVGNALVEAAGFNDSVFYVALYPLGKEDGALYYSGYVSNNSYGGGNQRTALLTNTATLTGRGPLMRQTYTAPA